MRRGAGLDRIILVGEAVSEGLFRDFRSVSKAKVFNLYGPTEAAVYVTAAQLQEGVPVHIGKPLRNCRVYVLDEKRNPVFPARAASCTWQATVWRRATSAGRI